MRANRCLEARPDTDESGTGRHGSAICGAQFSLRSLHMHASNLTLVNNYSSCNNQFLQIGSVSAGKKQFDWIKRHQFIFIQGIAFAE